MASSLGEKLTGSATLRITSEIARLKMEGKRVFNFGIGEPDFTTPRNIIDAGFNSAIAGKTHYTQSKGIIELREKIAERLAKVNGINATPENIIVTPTKHSIYIAVLSIIEPGDEVLLIEPYYLTYPDIIRLAGGKPVPVRSTDSFDPDFELLQKYVSPKTKAIIFNNPVNPTGRVYSRGMVQRLVDFVEANRLYLISDEIYDQLVYEGKPVSPASFPEISDRTVTLNGFSKSHAMTGWRIGYMHANSDLIAVSDKIQQATMTCAPSISQYACLEAIDDSRSVEVMRNAFRKRRDAVMRMLQLSSGLRINKPEGAFYVFPEFKLEINSTAFCEQLLKERQVALTPGSAFGHQGELHFRLSYAASDDELNEGVARIVQFVDSYR